MYGKFHQNAYMDPESFYSFYRRGHWHFLLLFLSWWGERGSAYHNKRAIIGPPAMAFRWRVDDSPTLNAGLADLWFFRGSVLLRKPYIFVIFFREVWTPCPRPLWIRAWNTKGELSVKIITYQSSVWWQHHSHVIIITAVQVSPHLLFIITPLYYHTSLLSHSQIRGIIITNTYLLSQRVMAFSLLCYHK